MIATQTAAQPTTDPTGTQTRRFEIAAFVNVSDGNFFGLVTGAQIAHVDDFAVEATSFEAAAEAMFEVGNRYALDADGKAWPSDVNSLSRGDMLTVCDPAARDWKFLAVDGSGWTETDGRYEIVRLGGTHRTSRAA